MKDKNQCLLETHGDKDLSIPLVHKAMSIYAMQFQKEWISVNDNLPENKEMVLIWRWDMPFIGYYDIKNNWWVINGVSDIGDIKYWKPTGKPI